MYKEMKTVSELMEKLREEGYIHDFRIENGIICNSDGMGYKPEDVIIEKTQRYEGDSDPSDNSIIYAITAKDGEKGVLLDSYGAYSDPEVAKIIAAIPVREEHTLQDSKQQDASGI